MCVVISVYRFKYPIIRHFVKLLIFYSLIGITGTIMFVFDTMADLI
jgi:hypothetical protein